MFSSPEQKAHWWAYRIGRPPSSVCLSIRRPHSLNIFSSETTGPIKAKFHMKSPWEGGTKICSNCPGHMTKLATMLIYGKKLKKSSPEPNDRWPWNLVCSIGSLSTTKFVQMMTGLTLTYFTAMSNLVPNAFVWEKGKTMDFSETIVVLAKDDQNDKKFLLTSKLFPLGSVCPLPQGYIHVLNHEINGIKSDFKEIFLKLVANDRSDKRFLLTSKFCPLGLSGPDLWLYTFY